MPDDIFFVRDVGRAADVMRDETVAWAVVGLSENSSPVVSREQFRSLVESAYQMPSRLNGASIGFVEGHIRPLWVSSDDADKQIPRIYMIPFLADPYLSATAGVKPRYEKRTQPDLIFFADSKNTKTAVLALPVKGTISNGWVVVVDIPKIYGVPSGWKDSTIEFAEWIKRNRIFLRKLADSPEIKSLEGNPIARLALWREALSFVKNGEWPDYPKDMISLDISLQAAMIHSVLRLQNDPQAKRHQLDRLAMLMLNGSVDGYAAGVAVATNVLFSQGNHGLDASARAVLSAAYKNATSDQQKQLLELAEILRDHENGHIVLMSGDPELAKP